MKEFESGVYLKPNGNLATVEFINEKYEVCTGKRSDNRLIKAFYPKVEDRPYMVWSCPSNKLAWGPNAFLNKCEFLGEL